MDTPEAALQPLPDAAATMADYKARTCRRRGLCRCRDFGGVALLRCQFSTDDNGEGARTLRPLQSSAVNYRIAFGPRAGQKMLTLRSAMPREATACQPLCADIDGNSAARRCTG